MRMILFASALAFSTAAMAQDAPPAPPPPPADATAPTPDATAPAPTAAAPADDSSLPTCSKTVTDKCKQGAGGGHHKAVKHHAKQK